MLIGELLKVAGWIPQPVPQGRSGLVWARGAPLGTLYQNPAASGQQEGDDCQARRDFALRGEGG